MDPKHTDRAILDRINELVTEERQLRAARHGLNADDRKRLQALEYQLDQAWDLLRQRRAREEADENPDVAHERSVDDVESYLQ